MTRDVQEIFTLAITEGYWTIDNRFMCISLTNMKDDKVITDLEYHRANDAIRDLIYPLGTLHDYMVAWTNCAFWGRRTAADQREVYSNWDNRHAIIEAFKLKVDTL